MKPGVQALRILGVAAVAVSLIILALYAKGSVRIAQHGDVILGPPLSRSAGVCSLTWRDFPAPPMCNIDVALRLAPFLDGSRNSYINYAAEDFPGKALPVRCGDGFVRHVGNSGTTLFVENDVVFLRERNAIGQHDINIGVPVHECFAGGEGTITVGHRVFSAVKLFHFTFARNENHQTLHLSSVA